MEKNIQSPRVFDLRQTNIAKGIACLFLIFHHIFDAKYFDYFERIVWIGDKSLVGILYPMGKVCVAMFLLLSGFGMNITFKKNGLLDKDASFKDSVLVCLKRLWKLWANYIIIFIIFVTASICLGRNNWGTPLDAVIDVFGMSFFFNKPTMNATWWYMSVAIGAYASTPVFAWLVRKHKELAVSFTALTFAAFVYGIHISWIFLYFCGFLFGEVDIFSKLQALFEKHKVKSFVMWTILLLVSVYLRYIYKNVVDFFFGSVVIVMSFLFISKIKIISSFLAFLGKHSGNIFMFHSFFIYTFHVFDIKQLVFAPKYVPFIFVVFVAFCLGISILLEFMKNHLFINKGIAFVGNKIYRR